MGGRARWVVGVACLSTGCAEPGPSIPDPPSIFDIQAMEGDATGDGWSGRWRFDAQKRSCECDPVDAEPEACGVLESVHLSTVSYEAVHDGGYLWLNHDEFQLSGPVYADGHAQLAGEIAHIDHWNDTEFPIVLDVELMEGDPATAAVVARQWLLGEHEGSPLACLAIFDIGAERTG